MRVLFILLGFGLVGYALWNFFQKRKDTISISEPTDTLDEQYNASKQEEYLQIDHILDKVSEHGLESLSAREKEILDKYSKT